MKVKKATVKRKYVKKKKIVQVPTNDNWISSQHTYNNLPDLSVENIQKLEIERLKRKWSEASLSQEEEYFKMNQQKVSINNIAPSKPEFALIIDELKQERSELQNKINKLYCFANSLSSIRTTGSDCDKNPEKDPQGITEIISSEIRYLRSINTNMENILTHLERVIGN